MKTTQETQTSPVSNLQYVVKNSETINKRLKELEEEWDLERVYELNTSFSALNGTLLGKILSKNCTSLPITTSAKLLHEKGQEWNAPISLFKSLGYRTKQEIEQEKNYLNTLREDNDSDFLYSAAAVA